VWATTAIAEPVVLKPTDFVPLTSLPWKRPLATLRGVLEAIFREPDIKVREAVLVEFLKIVPIEKLDSAFDICLDLEGTQTPEGLVSLFLEIWAKRDPRGCWKRTRSLFRFVVTDGDWLAYDSWHERITVPDFPGIRSLPFWVSSYALLSFPTGVEHSSLPKRERVRILKEFADVWISLFASLEGSGGERDEPRGLLSAFDDSLEDLRNPKPIHLASLDAVPFEISMRRWMKMEPKSAIEIIKRAQETIISGHPDQPAGPSTALFTIWADADLPAMIRWADSLDMRKEKAGLDARGFLMSRVDARTRDRWLAGAKAEKREDDLTRNLFRGWAEWDPRPALEAAVATGDGNTIYAAATSVVEGPWPGVFNACRHGIEVIKEFDVLRIPEQAREMVFENWDVAVLDWAPINIGEVAQYGVDFLLRTGYAPRENLIKLFSGDDKFSSDGDMIDRTFCALRVWAVVRPKEMKAWIATLHDAEMRKALTWLLENPWGGPEG